MLYPAHRIWFANLIKLLRVLVFFITATVYIWFNAYSIHPQFYTLSMNLLHNACKCQTHRNWGLPKEMGIGSALFWTKVRLLACAFALRGSRYGLHRLKTNPSTWRNGSNTKRLADLCSLSLYHIIFCFDAMIDHRLRSTLRQEFYGLCYPIRT